MNDDAQYPSIVEIVWREWEKKPESGCGHGVQFHDSQILESRGEVASLIAFVEGFGWIHGGSQAVVYYVRQHGLTSQEFNELKLHIEDIIRQKRPLELRRQFTNRIQAIANC